MSKKDVINYYNETAMLWLKYYGSNIQVFKLKDDINCVKTLNYLNKKLNIQENDLIFDVGCGIAAASIYFAKKMALFFIFASSYGKSICICQKKKIRIPVRFINFHFWCVSSTGGNTFFTSKHINHYRQVSVFFNARRGYFFNCCF